MIVNTAFLILAAGSASRMNQPKQLLPFKNDVLLTHVIKQALAVSRENVFVVLGANNNLISQEIKSFSVNILCNKQWKKGIGSSIAYGVSEIQQLKKYKRVVVLLADQPSISNIDIQHILEYHINHQNKITVTACINYTGVPAVFEQEFFNELMLLSNDDGAKPILKKHKLQVSKFVIDKEILDIDTPEEYDKILKSLDRLL